MEWLELENGMTLVVERILLAFDENKVMRTQIRVLDGYDKRQNIWVGVEKVKKTFGVFRSRI